MKAQKKKAKSQPHLRDYCDVETAKDEKGETIWPAPAIDMEAARAFIREWSVCSIALLDSPN